MATVNISPNTRVIAIKCRNTGGPYGLMTELKDGGRIISVSDASWKCSNRPHGGWEKPGFRGFPSQTIYTRQQGSFNRNIGEWRHMSRNRKVLWTRGGGRDKSIYCRKELRVQRLTLNSRLARVENNVDYWGADIRNFKSRGIQDCYNHCYRQAGCFSFTMRKRDNYCWLKRKFNGARRKTNQRHLVSANMIYKAARMKALLSINSKYARVENNVDYWGADIRSFRSKGIRDCYNHCYKQAGCVSFTMRKRDNYCWMKRKFNGARRKTNQRHLVSANMVYKAAQIKARRVKAARTLYLRYNNLYVSYGKRFNSYNAQYNSASKKVRTYVNQHNYWVRKANAEARAAKTIAVRHKRASLNYIKARNACNKRLATLRKAVNVQAAAHKKRAAANRAYIKKAKSFTGRIASAKKLQALRHRQRSAALKKFNSYKAKRHSYYVSYKRIAG